jgi:hypothetical protein
MDLLNDHDLTRLADERGMPIEEGAAGITRPAIGP